MAEWSVLKVVLKLAWTETDVPDSLTVIPSGAESVDVTQPTCPWEPQSAVARTTVLLLMDTVVKSTILTEIMLLLLRKLLKKRPLKRPLKKKLLKAKRPLKRPLKKKLLKEKLLKVKILKMR
jgi:hypothetical protein